MQTFVLVALTVLSIPILAFGQSQFGYRPMARGGNFVSNGRYQNQAPQTQYNPYQVPAVNHNGNQRSSNSVIGNTAVNTFGGGAVNSIVGSRFSDSGLSVNSVINPSSGSSNSVIGNTAYNTHGGGQRSSYGGNPYANLPGLSSIYDSPYGAQLADSILRNTFANLANQPGVGAYLGRR